MKGQGKDFRCILIEYSQYNNHCNYGTKDGASQSPYECTILKGGTAAAKSLGATISPTYGEEWWVIKQDGTLQGYGKGNNHNYMAEVETALASSTPPPTPPTTSAPGTASGQGGGTVPASDDPEGMGTATLVCGILFAVLACIQCMVAVAWFVKVYKPFGPVGTAEESQGTVTGLAGEDQNSA